MSHYEKATKQEVLRWLMAGIFCVVDGRVYKGTKHLTRRRQKRRRCKKGDWRVDLRLNNRRRSINVSHLVWMTVTGSVVPDEFEVHHRDLDNNDFQNLLCVHKLDHYKLHDTEIDDVPF